MLLKATTMLWHYKLQDIMAQDQQTYGLLNAFNGDQWKASSIEHEIIFLFCFYVIP